MSSTAIRSFNYQPGSSSLVVVFQTGRRYAFYDVPAAVFEAMQAARSHGAFFRERIRDRYSWSRLEDVGTATRPGMESGPGGRLMSWLRRLHAAQG